METGGFGDLGLWSPDSLVLIDSSAVVLWANLAAERLFGIEASQAIGTSAMELVHPDDRQIAAMSLLSIGEKVVGTPIELRVRTSDGWRLVELIGTNLAGLASPGGILLSLRDLTERRRWEVATNENDRFRSLVQNARNILMLTDEKGRVQSVSAAVTRILGHDQERLEGLPLTEIVAEADRERLARVLARLVEGPPGDTADLELDLLSNQRNDPLPFELSIVNQLDDPTIEGLIISAHEISQLREARETLVRLATRDTLTGLLNRASILRAVDDMVARAPRAGSPTGVLFLDLDHFKEVNDSLGHTVGDAVLREVADRFLSALRESDQVGRLGGDEFLVLVDNVSRGSLGEVADRLLESLKSPLFVPNEIRPELTVSASAGSAIGPYSSAEDLVSDADLALYEAKVRGRGHHVMFQPRMKETFRSRLAQVAASG